MGKWKADVDDKVFLPDGQSIPMVLFANKWDLVEDQEPSEREITDEVLHKACLDNNFIGWFSTSAKTGLNIKKGMNFIISKVMENRKAMEESMPPTEPDTKIVRPGWDDVNPPK